MKQVFKRKELIVKGVEEALFKTNEDSSNQKVEKGVIVNVGEKCELFKVGDTIIYYAIAARKAPKEYFEEGLKIIESETVPMGVICVLEDVK